VTSRGADGDHTQRRPAPDGDRAQGRPAPDGEHVAQGARPASGRVVISSVTGKPIAWDTGRDDSAAAPAPERRPILPDRVSEDEPEPGADESNDTRIAGEIPPHWGRGR